MLIELTSRSFYPRISRTHDQNRIVFELGGNHIVSEATPQPLQTKIFGNNNETTNTSASHACDTVIESILKTLHQKIFDHNNQKRIL